MLKQPKRDLAEKEKEAKIAEEEAKEEAENSVQVTIECKQAEEEFKAAEEALEAVLMEEKAAEEELNKAMQALLDEEQKVQDKKDELKAISEDTENYGIVKRR